MNGGDGSDRIDGGDGGDIIFGSNGDDELIGGEGADILIGGFGNDTLRGGGDDDVLSGGYGKDDFWGGEGADTFSFFTLVDSTETARDIIHDFEQGIDTINLERLKDDGISSMVDVTWVHEDGQTIISSVSTSNQFSFALDGIYDLTEQDFAF